MKIPLYLYKIALVILAWMGMICCSIEARAQVDYYQYPDFYGADSIASLLSGHPLVNMQILSNKLTQSLEGDLNKFRAIYRWVCNNIENDYTLYAKNKRKREKLHKNPEKLRMWNRAFSSRVFKKLLNERKTVCSGYAYLVKELAQYAGLSCEIIDGYGRTAQSNIGGAGLVNHSWNAIQLDNRWYLCDATWSSGSVDAREGKFLKEFEEGYFLAEPALFARNHYPLDTTWLLMDSKATLPTYLNQPLIYKAALRYKVFPLFPERFYATATKGVSLPFRFKYLDSNIEHKVTMQIVKGSTLVSLQPVIYKDTNGIFCMDYVFNAVGTYVVHILLEGDYVFTYEIRVTK